MDRLDLAVFPSEQTDILPLSKVFCEEGPSVSSNSGGRDISTKRSGSMKVASKLVTVSLVTGLAMLSYCPGTREENQAGGSSNGRPENSRGAEQGRYNSGVFY
jgi:hypothetical protein